MVMTPHIVSGNQLKIQALLIVYKLAHHGRAKPYDRSWCLRFILAFLYSRAKDGDRTHFDGFWKAATAPKRPAEPDAIAAHARRRNMQREANGICLAVGEQPKRIHDQFWDELTREAYASRGENVVIKR